MPRAVAALILTFVAVAGILVGLVAGGGGVVRTVGRAPAGGRDLPSFTAIVERSNPAVVHIAVAERPGDVPFGHLPGRGVPRRGEGSGFVVDPAGYVVTNDHVIEGSTRIRVRLADKRDLPARLVGTDPQTDLALLKVEADGLRALPLGDSDAVRVGDWVCAIGNPYGFDHSVTAGIVSSKGRKIWDASFDSYLQTDAAINPGNSGGPLLNASGEVVGINSAVIAEGQGIGFAVPVNVARDVLAQLKAAGRVSRGYLGIELQEMEPGLERLLGLAQKEGAVVLDVLRGSAAQAAGLRRYDVITQVGDRPVRDGDELVRIISARRPGSAVTLSLYRDGRKLSVEARLGERTPAAPPRSDLPRPVRNDGPQPDALGLTVVDLSDTMRGELSVPRDHAGVVVRDVRGLSPGAESLAHGDIVVEVNRRATPDRRAYERVLASLRPGDAAWLFVYRPRPAASFLARLDVEPGPEPQ
jgi:serine protease Do